MCGRARFAILANRQIRRFTGANRDQQQGNSQARTRRGRDPVTRSHNQVEDQADAVPREVLTEAFEHTETNESSSSSSSNEQEFHKIENCCPGMTLPILRYDESQQKVIVEKMVWGLIPPFQKSEKPDHYSMFNKRIESFTPENHYFNRLLSAKRCVIVFDGFYEWKLIAGKKQPYYVYFKKSAEQKPDSKGETEELAETVEEKEVEERAPLMMAGIWEDFKHDSSNPWLEGVTKSFSIITGMPSNAFKDVHNRQPIFLTDEQAQEWLNPQTAIFPLLKTVDKNSENDSFELNQAISFHPVNKKMTDPKYQASDCSAPYSLGGDMSSFLIKPGSSSTASTAAVRPKSTSVDAMCAAEGKKESREGLQSPDQAKLRKTVGEKRKIDSVDSGESFSPNRKPALSSPTKTKQKITPKTDGGISKFFIKR
jgi:putative SOS response-associated peptidase YedK